MIARLRGPLVERRPDAVVVDAGGVGYLVRVTLRTLAKLPETGRDVDLRTHTHVAEGAIELYGFAEADEQRAFELLLRVSGVGCRVAQQILSAIPPRDLAALVSAGDKSRLQAVRGIGPKTAARLIVELRDAFGEQFAASGGDDTDAQAVGALVALGLRPAQAAEAVRRARDAGSRTLEEIVREALRRGVQP